MSLSAQLGHFKVPETHNEKMKSYAPGSEERQKLKEALADMKSKMPFKVPCIVNGQKVETGKTAKQLVPVDHSKVLCEYQEADQALVQKAIDGALQAREKWEAMPFSDRAAIFLKAADLLSKKYRYKVMAATMWGQGKNSWQAEIDSAAELCDFWRFNAKFAEEIYQSQPPKNDSGVWNRMEYRGLEGFVLAVSPFNFTAIGGNLCSAPAQMGNVCIWKPAPNAMLSNYIVYEILVEAGLPAGVIQFVPGPAPEIVNQCINHKEFAGLHFTGSTFIFKDLWKKISNNLDLYKGFPRIVGETGGKNLHFLHSSADARHAALQTLRSAFEYQGQKCSACSRAYVPDNLWNEFKDNLLKEHKKIKVGSVEDFTNFVCAVINKNAFDKIKSYIDYAKSSSDAEVIAGGTYDDSVGYFVHPTIIVTKNPHFKTMEEEIFGPVLTIYVYPANNYHETLKLADSTSSYGLTGSLFAQDRYAVIEGANGLRHTAGNFYINDKSTGAVVGQQPFGGGRASGTNDKAGLHLNLQRWTNIRTIKESFVPIEDFLYPSNLP